MIFRKDFGWSVLRKYLSYMLRIFCIVTTLSILINGVITLASSNEWVLYSRDLLRILLTSFSTVLPLLLFAFFGVKTIKEASILRVVHFILTAIFFMVPLVLLREPGDITIRMGIAFFLIFSGVYGYITYRDGRVATSINEKLDAMHRDENATYPDENATHRD